MSKLGNAPLAVVSDDGARLQGLLHPSGVISDVVTPYASLAALTADLAAGKLASNGGVYRVGSRVFSFDGNILIESVQNKFNWPHINLGHAVIRSYLSNQGVNSYEQHRQALEIALPALVSSTAWNKIVELWVPLGANLTGALVKLKYPSGNSATLSNHNFVASDYTPTSGLTGDGSTKYLTSDANPYSLGLTVNNWGMAVHTPSLPTAGSNITANSVGCGVVSTSHFFYTLGQLFNDYVYDNDILVPVQPNYLNYNNGGGNVVPPYGLARTSWLQGFGGITSCGVGGLTLTSVVSSATNVVPNSTISIFSLNAGNYSNGTITGYALFSGMTQNELDVLSRFFDLINHLAYRPVMDGLLAFGDSIIRGNTLFSYTTQRWTYLLANMLGLSLANYGMDGSTMSVCPYLGNTAIANNYNCFQLNPTTSGISSTTNKSGYLALPLQNNGALVCVGLGMNDLSYSGSLSSFIAAYTQTLTQLQQAGFNMSNVLIASITYASAFGGSITNGYYTPVLAQTWNAALQTLANQFGCIYVDMFGLWNATNSVTYLNADGLHPNAAGHVVMASAAYTAICNARMPVIPSYLPIN